MNRKRQAANRVNAVAPEWSDEDTGALINAFAEGKTYSEIGAVVGKSREAVAGKCWRLKLKLGDDERHKRFRETGIANRAKQIAGATI